MSDDDARTYDYRDRDHVYDPRRPLTCHHTPFCPDAPIPSNFRQRVAYYKHLNSELGGPVGPQGEDGDPDAPADGA